MDDLGWFISHVFTDLSIFFDNVDVDGWTGVNSAGGSVAVALNWDFPVEPLAKYVNSFFYWCDFPSSSSITFWRIRASHRYFD